MTSSPILLIGVPADCGKRKAGCLMGPDAYRVAGLATALAELGHEVTDLGNLSPRVAPPAAEPNDHIYKKAEAIAWTERLIEAGQSAAERGFPVFMGGDHALAMGSVAGMAAHADKAGRPLFVLWLDAHSDYHTPKSTTSGNLHGTPVAYVTGREGFDDFPELAAKVDPANICMIGLRSVDAAERAALDASPIRTHDMREIDESGISKPLLDFLAAVRDANGLLHVSLDVDFLDPSIAPAVGTTVPGGATFREAHLVMELLHESGLVSSLDLVELNPFLDDRGRSASLMVDLTASLFGRKIFDRPTHSFH